MKLHRTRSRSRTTCHDGHAIGLDIGATYVRATMLRVEMVDQVASVVVDKLAAQPLEPGVVVNGLVVDAGAVTAAIKQLWRGAGFGCRNVVLGVASPQVMVRELTIPDLPAAQQERALPFQARDVIALPLDQVLLDFAPLGEPDPETGLVRGLLVASPRTPVLAAVAAAEAADLDVVRVDLASLALLRSTAEPATSVEAVVDLGAHLTTIVIHDHGVPRLVRTLATGGQELTQALVDSLGLSPEEAEAAKRTAGLTARNEVSEVLREAITPLFAEIRSSINYFRTGHPAALERIALTGGAAALSGLDEVLTMQNGAPSARTSPWDQVARGPASTAPADGTASALSVGLALGVAA